MKSVRNPVVEEGTVVISVSQSGGTTDTGVGEAATERLPLA